MGSNMARRLKECGFPIAAVYDMNTAAAQSLAQELGGEACADLRQVTKLSDVIITVVSDDKAMKKIYTGGLLSRSKDKLFINCATITPSVHVWVEGKAEKAGAQSLEACMASSITQAREGTLYLMLGGKPEVFERAKPILEKLSASMRYVGPAGKAAEVKALVNMVMNINTAALAEGLGLGAADDQGAAVALQPGRDVFQRAQAGGVERRDMPQLQDHHLGQRASRGRHERHATRHGFDRRQREAFVQRRHDGDLGLRVQLDDSLVAHSTHELDRALQTAPFDLRGDP